MTNTKKLIKFLDKLDELCEFRIEDGDIMLEEIKDRLNTSVTVTDDDWITLSNKILVESTMSGMRSGVIRWLKSKGIEVVEK